MHRRMARSLPGGGGGSGNTDIHVLFFAFRVMLCDLQYFSHAFPISISIFIFTNAIAGAE